MYVDVIVFIIRGVIFVCGVGGDCVERVEVVMDMVNFFFKDFVVEVGFEFVLFC